MTRCATLEEFNSFIMSPANRSAAMTAVETSLLREDDFTAPGFCAVCGQNAEFLVDYQYCYTEPGGKRVPNWRERVVCPGCGLNNRMRAATAFMLSASRPNAAIYLTEYVTPLFQAVASKRRRTVGSEYLGESTSLGKTNETGVRNEDVTCLTFADNSFSVIGTFDVLEHVPNYRLAINEFFRCLRPGGTLIVSVPFLLGAFDTLTRATVDASGAVTHLLPPDIHGNPFDQGGSLCFYYFGWDLVATLTKTGFQDAGLSMFWDARLGYLGGYQFIITARKPPRFARAVRWLRSAVIRPR
jgi:SAM-dependent methyltransferase